jgi:hypothetical protein
MLSSRHVLPAFRAAARSSDEAADFSLDTIMEEATSFEATVTPVPLPANIVRLADIIGN